MQLRKLAAAGAAFGLVATPIVAQASPAAVDRVGAPIDAAEEIGGGTSGLVIAILALAAVIAGIVIAVDDDEDEPVSP